MPSSLDLDLASSEDARCRAATRQHELHDRKAFNRAALGAHEMRMRSVVRLRLLRLEARMIAEVDPTQQTDLGEVDQVAIDRASIVIG